MSFSEWRNVKLVDIAEIIMGQSPKSEFYNNEGNGIPFMQGRTTFGYKYHEIDTWCTSPTRLAEKDTVLMSVRAPVGDVNIATQQLCIGRGLASLNMRNGNNEYLYYLLLHKRNDLVSRETGTVFGSINKAGLEGLDVFIPDNKEQKAIANILSSLDDKIELNNQMNETLEEMAQALFKRWFVDFEFPNEDGQPYKSSGGEMVESELGIIPKGWEVISIQEFSIIKNGKSLKPDLRTIDGENKIYGSNGIIGNTDESLQNNPCVVIGRVGAYCGSLQLSLNPCWITDNAMICYTKESIYLPYLYELLKTINIRERAGGSAQPLINQGILNKIKFVLPETQLLVSFCKSIFSSYYIKNNNQQENELLVSIRSQILPKLMSGEIRVSDLEE